MSSVTCRWPGRGDGTMPNAAADRVEARWRALVALDLDGFVAARAARGRNATSPCRPCRSARVRRRPALASVLRGERARTSASWPRCRSWPLAVTSTRRLASASGAGQACAEAATRARAPPRSGMRPRQRHACHSIFLAVFLAVFLAAFLAAFLGFASCGCTSAGCEPVVRRCRTHRSPKSCRSQPCGRGRPARSSCSMALTFSREQEHCATTVTPLEHPHAALVEQPIDQPLAGQRRVDQLEVLDGFDQRPPFDPGVVLGNHVRARCLPAHRRDEDRRRGHAPAPSAGTAAACRRPASGGRAPGDISSATASRTRVGICSELLKYSCAASSRLPP